MAFRTLIPSLLLAALCAVYVQASRPPYSPTYAPPTYRPAYSPKPSYHPRPSYHPAPYHPRPSYHPAPYKPAPYHPRPSYKGYDGVPECAKNSSKVYCLQDEDYPEYEVKHAITEHKYKFLELYADVADLSTENSVDRLTTLEEETYLCPSETIYCMPKRAINTDGKWRVVVNKVKVDYDTFTQTARVEECGTPGDACPLVPPCYESSCHQKFIYHRFVVYDPYDQYFPFAIETFKFPASCACRVGAFDFASAH